jgi:hypothetical protein
MLEQNTEKIKQAGQKFFLFYYIIRMTIKPLGTITTLCCRYLHLIMMKIKLISEVRPAVL